MTRNKFSVFGSYCLAAAIAAVSTVGVSAQTETPPAPAAPKTVRIPAIQEKKLSNGLTVATVERNNAPLVTVQLMIRAGASSEPDQKAGLADLTASMLTKGTKTRTATQIAEDMEFLGGSLDTGAGWNNSDRHRHGHSRQTRSSPGDHGGRRSESEI
jgi:zinc protease